MRICRMWLSRAARRSCRSEKLPQYLKNPEFKRMYDQGAEIAAHIGHVAAAETFNPVIVDFYREVGYLPDAIINYLMLLGWFARRQDRGFFLARR